ncbi:MAG: tRNA (5-methylaminomethyl-2-thiouridine)(34)-methyltransferase MnmD [Bacteriovoracaceae bacterium]
MDNLKSAPPKHSWVSTEDGSFTLFSEEFQEACHSTTGAKSETLLHYISGCRVKEKAQQGEVTILEVGFGLGVGMLTTTESVPEAKLTFLSLEIDEDLVEWFRLQNPHFEWKSEHHFKYLHYQNSNLNLFILVGDARKTLQSFLEIYPFKFNVIYQDAFSPKKNPTLWTKQWFKLLKENSLEDVILSTYSASTSIRKSLAESGWKIHKGDKFGPKRTSTRATLNGETDPDILLQMERSPTPALSDDNINTFLTK